MSMTSHSDLVSGMWADECAGCCACAASIAHGCNSMRGLPDKGASLKITKYFGEVPELLSINSS
jgi:hypothetical protein